VPGEDVHHVRPLQAAVFIAELALLAVLAIAGADLAGGTAARIALAVLFPLIAAVLWALRLAPRARRRLAYPARLIAKLALVAVAAALLIAAGRTALATNFYVISALLLTAGELSERRRARSP
jgi:hypothetical protein